MIIRNSQTSKVENNKQLSTFTYYEHKLDFATLTALHRIQTSKAPSIPKQTFTPAEQGPTVTANDGRRGEPPFTGAPRGRRRPHPEEREMELGKEGVRILEEEEMDTTSRREGLRRRRVWNRAAIPSCESV